ncbi:hypothetical protein C8039_19140 [Halogeometricum sp. wsp3]|nr:hypothetical protein C8039_19140 [Halogeometricum sp. wsp3]
MGFDTAGRLAQIQKVITSIKNTVCLRSAISVKISCQHFGMSEIAGAVRDGSDADRRLITLSAPHEEGGNACIAPTPWTIHFHSII